MAPSLTRLCVAAVIALAAQSAAQQCYYPNGASAPETEKPCSSAEGSACCPDNWECLDNGLCHYPANNLYGRYSCTDKNWNSPGCPKSMCTYDMSAAGGESITQCSNHGNDWCCNGDDVHVKCCQESPAPRPFFALQDGRAYATIGSNTASSVPTISGITGLASGTGSGSGSSTAPTSSSAQSSAGSRGPSATADSVSATPAPFTSVQASVSSGSAGIATIYITSIITPTSNPTAGASNNNPSSSTSNIGLIVGCAVGIPLALALIGILVWLLRKRRNIKANPYKETSQMDAESSGSSGGAGGAAAKLSKDQKFRQSRLGTAEIDGNPVGAGRPISTIPGSAELPSGSGFQPGQGTAYAPDGVGIGGGNAQRNTWGSVPPQYSPAPNQTTFPSNAAELDDTSVMPVINEKPQYEAYRPPPGTAELSTLTTPPEDTEKQLAK